MHHPAHGLWTLVRSSGLETRPRDIRGNAPELQDLYIFGRKKSYHRLWGGNDLRLSVPFGGRVNPLLHSALQRDEGDAYWVFGELYTFKVTALEAGGGLAVLETLTTPQNGPPLHTHSREDESFYVLEGRFLFTLGEQNFEVGPGGFVFAPRGIPHAYRNISALPARKIVVITPGGFESFLREIGEPATQRVAPPPHRPGVIQKAVELSSKYGLRIHIPDGVGMG
jgi:quercetin dioxygenase-like cupin family protein